MVYNPLYHISIIEVNVDLTMSVTVSLKIYKSHIG